MPCNGSSELITWWDLHSTS